MARKSRRDKLMLALTLALALFGAAGKPGKAWIVLICLAMAILVCWAFSSWASRKDLSSAEKIGRWGFLVALVLSGAAVYGWQFWPRGTALVRPAPPTSFSATSVYEVPFNYPEKRLVTSQERTPCSLKGRRTYTFDELGSAPGGGALKRTWLVAKPLRVLMLNRSAPREPRLTTPPDSYDLLFEISVTNRGEATVAKDWRLCLARQGKPVYYKPYEIRQSDVTPFGSGVLLEQATIAAPIERGHLVNGWILFRVPKDMFQEFVGSIECRDYLEKRFATNFAPLTAAQR